MSKFQEKAEAISADMGDGGVSTVALDPFTISVIVQVLSELVKLYMQCRKTPAEATVSMRDPGLIERWRLRRVIKKHLDDDEVHGVMGSKLFSAVLRSAAAVSADDVAAMYKELEK
jgi:hypothetical protein